MLRPYYQTLVPEAGCDEAGRGCLAGPVVAAAVILPHSFSHPLLNDSKQLSPQQRALLAPIIKEEALAWAIASCSPEEIDQHNILWASVLAMHRAVAQLTARPDLTIPGPTRPGPTRPGPTRPGPTRPGPTRPGLLLIDGNRFKPYPFIQHMCVVKGDSLYASIAAASVLAKTQRDEQMEALALQYPAYGWERNMGYPTQEHKKALLEYGPTPWHRQTFKGVKG